MKKINHLTYFLLLSLLFSGCSNLTIGFEENSIFYKKPKEEVVSVDDKSPLKLDPKPTKTKKINNEDTENKTTFSYNPYDGE